MDRTLDDGSHYVGEWKNGKGNGQGTYEHATGEKYVGEFKNNKKNGQGKNTFLNGEYLEGYFKNDILINGFMDRTLDDGSRYVGEFKDGNYNGQGKFTWPNGEFLEGYFENSNLINGFMDRTYNGSHYVGEWKNGKKNGLGINTFPNGRVQEGFWKNDQFQYTQDIGSSPKIAQKKPDRNDSNSSKSYNQIPDDKEITASSGSGFAVSEDGYIITNNHVIDQCQSVVIHFEGEEIPATVVSYDTKNDLALLKGDFSPQTIFPLSNSRPELLQDVYVAGYPFGVQISSAIKVTKGIISSLTGIGNNFSNIQIDAALQSGNSGGPILDDLGNVVGVAVSKLDAKFMYENYGSIPENTNFGIKANVVKSILDSNNVAYPKSNAIDIDKSELARMITNGTYYLSCMMTMAQIKEMKTKKVLFENLN